MGKIRRYHDKQPRERLKLSPQHWTRHDNHYKAKKPYETEDDAWEYLQQKPWLIQRGYTAYQCGICCKWHIGRLNVKENYCE